MKLSWLTSLVASALALVVAGCPTVDLGELPEQPPICQPDRAYYETVIWPEFLATADQAASCVGAAGCHNLENAPRTPLRLSTVEPIDHAGNYQVVTRSLNCSDTGASPLLTKPLTGVDPHGGGDLFATGSNQELVFESWFAQ